MKTSNAASTTPRTQTSPVLRELSGGVVAACLTLPLCVGAGVLAYAPLGPDQVSRGAMAGLYGAMIGGAVAALARRSSFVATFPTTPIAAIQSSIAATLLAVCGDPARLAVALTACLVLAGLLQAAFALTGVSRLMRFVPHPVMAGFVSGVAALIASNQLAGLLGVRSLDQLGRGGALLPRPLAAVFGLVILLAILALPRVVPRVPNLLAGLVLGTAAFHGLHMLRPALDLGATIGALPASPLQASTGLSPAPWLAILGTPGLLPVLVSGALTLAVVGTLDTFFALRTVQFVGDVAIDPRRDVGGQGLANVAAALVSGTAVSTSLSVSMANYNAGGRTRLSTLASAATLFLGGVLFPRLITVLPLVVIAAVLGAVSLRLVDRWSFHVLWTAVSSRDPARRRRAARDGLVIVAVFLATVLGKAVAGVAVGFGLSCVLFVLDMSRPVVARTRNGTTLRSKRLRSPKQQARLRAAGDRLRVLELQGALFFGNAQAFAAELEAVGGAAAVVVLDCRRLTGVDTTGLTALDQAATRLRRSGRRLIVAAPAAEWAARAYTATRRQPDYIVGSLEEALELAEEQLLADPDGVERGGTNPALAAVRPLDAAVAALEGRLEVERFPAGAALCRAGEPAERMWILRRGIVRVEMPSRRGGLLLARLGPGSTVGEIGFIERGPRSADVVADEDVDAFVLTREALGALLVEDSETGQALLSAVAAQLAHRLRETSGALGDAEGGA